MTPEAFAGIPLDLLERLERAITIVDIDKPNLIGQESRMYDIELVDTIAALIKSFDYHRLLTPIQRAKAIERGQEIAGIYQQVRLSAQQGNFFS